MNKSLNLVFHILIHAKIGDLVQGTIQDHAGQNRKQKIKRVEITSGFGKLPSFNTLIYNMRKQSAGLLHDDRNRVR